MLVEKKVGKLKPETKEKLELCLEMASTDAVDLITEAYAKISKKWSVNNHSKK